MSENGRLEICLFEFRSISGQIMIHADGVLKSIISDLNREIVNSLT